MSGRSVVVSLVLVVVVAVAAIASWSLLRQDPNARFAAANARTAPAAGSLPAAAPAPAPALKAERTSVKERSPHGRGLFGGLFGGGGNAKESETEEPRKIAVDGIVIVTDAQGTEHREESGTLAPSFYEPAREEAPAKHKLTLGRSWQSGDEVNVAAGRFHVEVPPEHQLGAGKLVLGGRAARVVGDPVDVVAGQPVTIRARWIDGIRLRVVDATTHADLDDVTVARPRDHGFATMSHPGAAASIEIVADHTASPVTVDPQSNLFGVQMNEAVFVRAAGHAWTRVDLNFEDATEKTVALGAAAALIVTLQGELPHRAPPTPSLDDVAERLFGGGPPHGRDRHDGEPMICLREPTHAPDFDDEIQDMLANFGKAKPEEFPGGKKPSLGEFREMVEKMRGPYEATRNLGTPHVILPAVLGETHVDAIEPGEFVVSVEIGEHSGTPLVAGRADVTLIAGETKSVTIVLAPIAASEPVPLAGTLFVPAGWETERLDLTITPIDLPGKTRADDHEIPVRHMVALPGRTGWYHWSAGDVLPASWLCSVQGTGFSRVVKIEPPGNDHLELTLAEPATLIVHVVDDANGQPVDLQWLSFTPERRHDWIEEPGSISLVYDDAHARFSARVPIGAGAIATFGDEEWTLDETTSKVDVHAGEQEVTLRVRRACGVLVALTCGGAKVAWPEDLAYECEIVPVDDQGRSSWTSTRDDLPCLAVALAGRYRVKLPEIPGYAPVEPFEVDVPAGRFITQTVELTRN